MRKLEMGLLVVAAALLAVQCTALRASCTTKECTEGNCWDWAGGGGPAGCYELDNSSAECAYSNSGNGNIKDNGSLRYKWQSRTSCTAECTNKTSRANVCGGTAGGWSTNTRQVKQCVDPSETGSTSC